MHQIAVLPTDLVGTYSCHGIDSNQDKINQDAACICYPLTGDPHTAVLIVVDGHGELGHDVTDEVIKQLVARTEQHSWGGEADDSNPHPHPHPSLYLSPHPAPSPTPNPTPSPTPSPTLHPTPSPTPHPTPHPTPLL